MVARLRMLRRMHGRRAMRACRLRGSDGGRAVWVVVVILALCVAVVLFVFPGYCRRNGDQWRVYQPETGEFTLNVPAGWDARRAEPGKPAFGPHGGFETFSRPGVFVADVHYTVAALTLPPLFRPDDMIYIAGHLDSRGGGMIGFGVLQAQASRYPITSRSEVVLDGARGMDYVMEHGDPRYSKKKTIVWNRLVIRDGKLYSLLFSAPESEYNKHIERIQASAASLQFASG